MDVREVGLGEGGAGRAEVWGASAGCHGHDGLYFVVIVYCFFWRTRRGWT